MSELRAIKPVSTAFEKTKRLLLEPFDAFLWLKLVIIIFFIGSSGSSSFNPGNTMRYTTDESGNSILPELIQVLSDPVVIGIIIAMVLIALAFVLLFIYLKAVFSFVLVESLASGNVRIIQPFVDNMGRGFKVFLFNIAMSLITLVGILIFIGVMLVSVYFLVTASPDTGSDIVSMIGVLVGVVALLTAILVFFLFTMVMGIILGFFYEFGIPLMYFKGMGLKEAIGHVFGLVKREPVEFLAYMILRWILAAAVGLAFLLIFILVLTVFFIAGLLLFLLAIVAYQISVWLLVPIALVFVLGIILWILIVAFLSMPVAVYFRYYSLDFLRSFDPSYVKYSGRFGGEPAGLIGQ